MKYESWTDFRSELILVLIRNQSPIFYLVRPFMFLILKKSFLLASTSVMLPNQGQSHVCPSQRSHRGCGSISKMLRNDGLLQRKCAIPKSLPPSYSRTVIIVHQFYGQVFDRFQCHKSSLLQVLTWEIQSELVLGF